MTIYLFPAIIVDMVGSTAMIILSFMACYYAYKLNNLQPDNFLWGFLIYFCLTIAFFSISRSVGHLFKQTLYINDMRELWPSISPFVGGMNTLLMISLSAVIIFYHKGVEGYLRIKEKAAGLRAANIRLEKAGEKMAEMNQNLEETITNRTQELAKSERKFRSFFQNSKDMVYFCDIEDRVVDINKAGLEMLGYIDSAVEKPTLYDMFYDDDELQNYFEDLRAKGFVSDCEIKLKKSNGRPINVLLSATALYDEYGTFVGCEGIAKDLTRLNMVTEQLINHEKMATVGQMAAGVAHEINTPLGIILGYAQLMKDDFPKDSEEFENIGIIERQSKTCRTIVSDLLKFSRQSESTHSNIDINTIITDILAVTEHNLQLHKISVVRKLSTDLPTTIGDQEKIGQVIINLINNSQHAMEKRKGTLTITTEHNTQKDCIHIKVSDTGTGIPPHLHNKIFDPFFTTKPVGIGSGLGMSVSYGIIEDHGGHISIESPTNADKSSENKGATIHIYLPILQSPDNNMA